MLLFDSHAHYYDARFDDAGEGENADTLLHRMLQTFGGNIGGIINVATNNQNALSVLSQASRYPEMYAALGIHPEDCQEYPDPEHQMRILCTLLGCDEPDPVFYRTKNKIVAIGEIGLDYYEYHLKDKALQAWYLEQQLCLAEKLNLPVIIHARDAHGDCFEAILRHPGLRGVFHSYSGSREMAQELVRRGFMISFSGVVTFQNARRVQEVAAAIPPEALLSETDCPYLAPHPCRGRRNDSSLLHYTVEMLAQLHHIPAEQMAQITFDNALRLFNIGQN